jgi:hypothetical protein
VEQYDLDKKNIEEDLESLGVFYIFIIKIKALELLKRCEKVY